MDYEIYKIYQGDCISNGDYIGETELNVVTRLRENNNPTHDSGSDHHLKNQLNHSFVLLLLMHQTKNRHKKSWKQYILF